MDVRRIPVSLGMVRPGPIARESPMRAVSNAWNPNHFGRVGRLGGIFYAQIHGLSTLFGTMSAGGDPQQPTRGGRLCAM